jgi:hypothetical protein
MNCKSSILFILGLFIASALLAQSAEDSTNKILQTKALDTSTAAKVDSVVKKKHIPAIATRRSAIIPGWGQAYNRQYWKIPLVYTALGIPAYTFAFNTKYYKMTQFAYNALYLATYGSNSTIGPTRADSLALQQIDPEIKDGVISGRYDLATLQTARNQYRRNRDYSIFWFLIAWGLNVVDATVSGHLKDFNISDDLSMHISPTFIPAIKSPGLSVVLNLKTPPAKTLKVSAR